MKRVGWARPGNQGDNSARARGGAFNFISNRKVVSANRCGRNGLVPCRVIQVGLGAERNRVATARSSRGRCLEERVFRRRFARKRRQVAPINKRVTGRLPVTPSPQ